MQCNISESSFQKCNHQTTIAALPIILPMHLASDPPPGGLGCNQSPAWEKPAPWEGGDLGVQAEVCTQCHCCPHPALVCHSIQNQMAYNAPSGSKFVHTVFQTVIPNEHHQPPHTYTWHPPQLACCHCPRISKCCHPLYHLCSNMAQALELAGHRQGWVDPCTTSRPHQPS